MVTEATNRILTQYNESTGLEEVLVLALQLHFSMTTHENIV